MKRLEVRFAGTRPEAARQVGTLIAQGGRIFFEYQEDWLRSGLNLSPFRLPFRGGLFRHDDLAFGPLPGVFDDSLPDGWGRLLLDRHVRNLGRDPASLDPLDRLAWIGSRAMGALTYHPPAPGGPDPGDPFDLEALARQSRDLLSGRSREVLPHLLRAGGSPGGARPKVLVGFRAATDELVSGEDELPPGFEAWMIKFSAREETRDAGPTEYAYALMARAAGLEMPETRLFETPGGRRYFGVKRFDRQGLRRFHVHTFGNLLQVDFRIPSCDYSDLLKTTSLLVRNHDHLQGVLRKMIFNVLAHNRDDHAKNFAFLLDDRTGEWAPAPAYDLTFSPGPGGEHAMTLAGEGHNPGPEHILRLAADRDLPRSEATTILEEVRTAVDRWPEFARAAGVPRTREREIARTLGIRPEGRP